MKTREEAARFIERQMHWTHECSRQKDHKVHYGWQDLRELMDFIYEGKPTEEECLNELPRDWRPEATAAEPATENGGLICSVGS